MTERVLAPLGRRECRVSGRRETGGYVVFSALDADGPEPLAGQFYMLAGEPWEGEGGRPYLARAFSVAAAERRADGVQLDFLVEAVGPGTERLAALEPGGRLHLTGPLGAPFSSLSELAPGAAGAILVGGGIGIAPLALLRRALVASGTPTRTLLGFRDEVHSGGLELFDCSEIRLASEDGHAGHKGYVTDLLSVMLEGDDAGTRGRLRLRAAGDARGGPGDLRRSLRPGRARDGGSHGVRLRRLLRLRGAARGGRLHAPVRRRTGGPRGGARLGARRGVGALTELGIEIAGLRLAHPVLNGSGTFDALAAQRAFGPALLESFPFSAFVSKTITPQPRAGNPPPRLYESASGLINSIGLPNKGLEGFLATDLPELARLPVPLIVSVMATSHREFERMVAAVAERDEVAALELNVSCPNVESGLIVGASEAETRSLVTALRAVCSKPLIVKLTPNAAEPEAIARAAEDAGADAVSLINTLKARPTDPRGLGTWLGAGSGGLSGPAVRTIALDQVARVAARVSIPVIGMGGIESGRHALEFLAAGARAVAVGTASFRDPMAGTRVLSELSED